MTSCSCERFERLAGAAIKAYSADFLERASSEPEKGTVYYRCKVCGTPWKRVDAHDHQPAALIKLPRDATV